MSTYLLTGNPDTEEYRPMGEARHNRHAVPPNSFSAQLPVGRRSRPRQAE